MHVLKYDLNERHADKLNLGKHQIKGKTALIARLNVRIKEK